MKEIKKLIILLILLLPLVQAQDFSNYQSLNLNFSINSQIDVTPTTQNPVIEELKAVISLSPIEDKRQKIIQTNIITEPKAKTSITKEITLKWQELETDRIYFNVQSEIQTENIIPKITAKIEHPFSIPSSAVEYTAAGNYIDINYEITKKAQELKGDKTNLYEIVFAIANWTNYNIEYDLDTLTAESIQKSSWVYQNRRGVCDEITNIFISLLRSINIPAKFIGGTVHSNLIGGWGNHGWAEVYFPKYGWIPFDITLGQFGWIDPSHVKLIESVDSSRPTANYKWRSYGVKLSPSKLNIDTYLQDTNGQLTPPVSVDIKPLAEKVGFNSYIPVKVVVTNLVNYPIIPKIYLSKGPSPAESVLYLKPKEKKTIYWLLKLPTLSDSYQYTSDLEVTTSFGSTDSTTVKISDAYNSLTQEQAALRVDSTSSKDTKKTFKDLTISCFPESSDYYSKSNININCKIENKGAKKDLQLCIHDICQDITVDKTEEITVQTMAAPEIEIYVEDENYIKYADINPEIINVPELDISSIKPLNMEYNEEVELTFTISTKYPAYNLKIYLNGKNIYEAEKLTSYDNLKLKLNSRALVNNAKFKMIYEDSKGRTYTKTIKFLTTVRNAPWYSKVFNMI